MLTSSPTAPPGLLEQGHSTDHLVLRSRAANAGGQKPWLTTALGKYWGKEGHFLGLPQQSLQTRRPQTTEICSLIVWRPEVRDQGVDMTGSFWRFCRAPVPGLSASSRGLPQSLVPLGPWRPHCHLCPAPCGLLCVSTLPPLSPIRTPVPGFRAPTKFRTTSSQVLNSVTPAMTLF